MKTTLVNSVKWCLGVASLSLATFANANFVTNGSFVEATGGWTYSNEFVGWFDDRGIADSGAGGYRPPAPGASSGSGSGFITQLISPLNASQSYLLEFYLKPADDVTITFTFGGRPFASFDPDPQGQDPFNSDELHFIREDDPETGWFYYSTVISAFTGGVISFEFSGVGELSEGFVDDVSLTCENGSLNLDCSSGNNVPEPGSLLLVGAALAGLGLARRRKTA